MNTRYPCRSQVNPRPELSTMSSNPRDPDLPTGSLPALNEGRLHRPSEETPEPRLLAWSAT